MAPMPLSDALRQSLLRLALGSIRHGLENGKPLPVQVDAFDPTLRQRRACFVTLNRAGNLRGCIGHLEAVQPLVKDVADNAFAAAFSDPRFPSLRAGELPELDLHISILSLPEPIAFQSEADLIAQIRPGIDGLILQDGRHRGTFLPSVWESLPEPHLFWSQLKRKAGLPTSHWSSSLQVSRYTTEAFGAATGAIG